MLALERTGVPHRELLEVLTKAVELDPGNATIGFRYYEQLIAVLAERPSTTVHSYHPMVLQVDGVLTSHQCREMRNLYYELRDHIKEIHKTKWCFWKYGGEDAPGGDGRAIRMMKRLKRDGVADWVDGDEIDEGSEVCLRIPEVVNNLESKVPFSSALQMDPRDDQRTRDLDYALEEHLNLLPGLHGSNPALMHYGPNASYAPHADCWTDINRQATLLVYLDSVRGGHTDFPGLNASVEPKCGRAVIFSNLLHNEELNEPECNEATLHASAAVQTGEKMVYQR